MRFAVRCVTLLAARAHGMRASGLEDHFADLMREAGALDTIAGTGSGAWRRTVAPVHLDVFERLFLYVGYVLGIAGRR